MMAPKNSRSQPGGVESPFFPCCLVKKKTCCGSKNDFYKKSGGLVFNAKVQNHPGSTEIGRNLHKIQKIPSKAMQQNES
jgi:hypothetical protein